MATFEERQKQWAEENEQRNEEIRKRQTVEALEQRIVNANAEINRPSTLPERRQWLIDEKNKDSSALIAALEKRMIDTIIEIHQHNTSADRKRLLEAQKNKDAQTLLRIKTQGNDITSVLNRIETVLNNPSL